MTATDCILISFFVSMCIQLTYILVSSCFRRFKAEFDAKLNQEYYYEDNKPVTTKVVIHKHQHEYVDKETKDDANGSSNEG